MDLIFSLAGIQLDEFGKWSFTSSHQEEIVSDSPLDTKEKEKEEVVAKDVTIEDELISSQIEGDNKEIKKGSDAIVVSEVKKADEFIIGGASDGNDAMSPGRKKKKKKKKGKQSTAEEGVSPTPTSLTTPTPTPPTTPPSKCRVKWGNAINILFERDLSASAVPNSGAFPLGLGKECERVERSVDDQCSIMQADLIQRAREQGIDTHFVGRARASSVSEEYEGGGRVGFSPLESRQYDYRSDKNKLFSPLSEEERIVILGQDPSKFEVCQDCSLSEFNTSVKAIRLTRDDSGCTCRAVKLDKLSVVKMKARLEEMNEQVGMNSAQINALSKAQLITILKEALKDCPMCITNDCICIQMGVSCTAEVCACLKRGISSDGKRQECLNPNGQDIFNVDKVNEYRRVVLESVGCSPSKRSRASTFT